MDYNISTMGYTRYPVRLQIRAMANHVGTHGLWENLQLNFLGMIFCLEKYA